MGLGHMTTAATTKCIKSLLELAVCCSLDLIGASVTFNFIEGLLLS